MRLKFKGQREAASSRHVLPEGERHRKTGFNGQQKTQKTQKTEIISDGLIPTAKKEKEVKETDRCAACKNTGQHPKVFSKLQAKMDHCTITQFQKSPKK